MQVMFYIGSSLSVIFSCVSLAGNGSENYEMSDELNGTFALKISISWMIDTFIFLITFFFNLEITNGRESGMG